MLRRKAQFGFHPRYTARNVRTILSIAGMNRIPRYRKIVCHVGRENRTGDPRYCAIPYRSYYPHRAVTDRELKEPYRVKRFNEAWPRRGYFIINNRRRRSKPDKYVLFYSQSMQRFCEFMNYLFVQGCVQLCSPSLEQRSACIVRRSGTDSFAFRVK